MLLGGLALQVGFIFSKINKTFFGVSPSCHTDLSYQKFYNIYSKNATAFTVIYALLSISIK